MRYRLGVRGRLLFAFFGISAFALLAAGAAMYSFLEVGKTLEKITQQRVPLALASLEISRQAERIVAVAPALLAVTTPDQQEQVSSMIIAEVEHLNELLNELKGGGVAAPELGSIEAAVGQVNTNLAALDALVEGYLDPAAACARASRDGGGGFAAWPHSRRSQSFRRAADGDHGQVGAVDRHVAAAPKGPAGGADHQRYPHPSRVGLAV